MGFVPLLCAYKKQAPESPQELKRAQREEEFPEPNLRGAGVALALEESINEDVTVAGVHSGFPSVSSWLLHELSPPFLRTARCLFHTFPVPGDPPLQVA